MKFKIFLFIFFVILLWKLFPNTNSSNIANDDVIIDTTKVAFFIDDRYVSTSEWIRMDSIEDLIYIGGVTSRRDAIIFFGEKYRDLKWIYVYKRKNQSK